VFTNVINRIFRTGQFLTMNTDKCLIYVLVLVFSNLFEIRQHALYTNDNAIPTLYFKRESVLIEFKEKYLINKFM